MTVKFKHTLKKPEKLSTKTPEEIVEEIHDTFFTEVDRLLEFASTVESIEPENMVLMEKADRLRRLGFTQSKPIKDTREDQARIEDNKRENKEREELKEAILYFKSKYPYKFITEESVAKICEKYGLAYGPADKYTGDIPERNITEMENFKIEDKDKAYQFVSEYSDGYEYADIKEFQKWEKGEFNDETEDYFMEIDFEEAPLFIAAPVEDFDTSDLVRRGPKLEYKTPPQDPIVLQPVIYGNIPDQYSDINVKNLGYLIVTAWGPESMDPLVFNESNN